MEIEMVKHIAMSAGAEDAVMSDHWAEGGAGSEELAHAVVAACAEPSNFHFLYPKEASIKQKIEAIAVAPYNTVWIATPGNENPARPWNRSRRRFSGSSLRMRFSFMRACSAPLAVGAPRSLCSMPEAR